MTTLVQNNQYVESEEVIVQICVETSTLNFKERSREHIYFNAGREMHWSTDVHFLILPKKDHLWKLSGRLFRADLSGCKTEQETGAEGAT